MPQLNTIASDADSAEAKRVLDICNACRYCEGFCATFQALSLRRTVQTNDIDYLANLCHNCTACFHACQYAPPHEFSINAPQVFSRVRTASYERFAWPGALAILFQRNGLVVSLVSAITIALTLLFGSLLISPEVLFESHNESGAFYLIISHQLIAMLAGSIFLFGILSMIIGTVRFWRTGDLPIKTALHPEILWPTLKDVAALRYLGGGHGKGCNTENESFSNQRRIFHQFTMWGFLLSFAATCVATFYEYGLGRFSPFPYFSLPVILGTLGGIGLLLGPAGLTFVKLKSDSRPMNISQYGMDYAFLASLFFVSLTGLALLLLRETSAMGVLFLLHFGFVLALFLLLPYSKFVHGIYRFAALLRFHGEKRIGQ